MKNIIELKNVSKFYYKKGIIAQGFNKINLRFKMGEFVVITGESGSGKSTLLNILSGLDSYSEGEMYINGEETSHYTERDKEEYRRRYIGNIFQTFNLINSYTVYQNIELVLLLNGYKKKDVKEKILELIKKVELTKFKNTKVSKLSGGQKQRVAIARALAKETPIIIADEPTGNLDSRSAKAIVALLADISKEKLVIMVTHNYSEVEEYATRKIKMHDGQVIEDKQIKEGNNVEKVDYAYFQPISFGNKLRLGIRNAFNVIPKFVLLLAVFVFVSLALIFQYANYSKGAYELTVSGFNYIFADTSSERIIVKKEDNSAITDEDYANIQKLDNIDYIVKNDLLVDEMISLTDDNNLYIDGYYRNINFFDGKIAFGRMPENDNEIVIQGNEFHYIIEDYQKLIDEELYLESYDSIKVEREKYRVVGISYLEDDYSFNITIYGKKDDFASDLSHRFSDIKILFQDKYYDTYSPYFMIAPNDKVARGTVYMNSDINYYCAKYNCKNKTVAIETSSLYYNKTTNLKITNLYNSDNIQRLLGIKSVDDNFHKMYINPLDYADLYDNQMYQSSVFVKDPKMIKTTSSELTNLGFKTLIISDTLVSEELSAIFQILQLIVMIITIVVLFFISYFIIKIIIKSRNFYYSTIRMLGATGAVSKSLLVIDLLTIATLSYSMVVAYCSLIYTNIIKNDTLYEILSFMSLKNYILFYLVLVAMVYLICTRYVRKTFKDTMINTYREEV